MFPKFSIIIPFYNSASTIERLINSIPARDDVEIFIVDDNSRIEEIQPVFDISLKRPDISVLRSETNLGAGHARNIALEKAKGNWLIFADADDYFMPCFNECLNKYVDADLDLIFFSATSIYEGSGEISTRHRAIENQINAAQKNKKGAVDDLRFNFYGPVCKFVSRRMVAENNIRFQETFAFNDALFSVSVGYYAKKIKICGEPIYCITECPKSISYTLSENVITSRIRAIFAVNRFYKNHSIKKFKMPLIPQIIYARKLGAKAFFRILKLSVKLKFQ